MKKKEVLIEEHKAQKILLPHTNEEGKRIYNRQNSMRNFYKQKKNEKIIPIKRITKSREKEIKRIIPIPVLPLIKQNSFKSKSKINNIPQSINNIKKKEIHDKLPNLIIKKSLNDNRKNSINNKIDNNNNIKKNEINENCKNSELNQNKEIAKINNVNLDGMIKFFEEFIELSISLPNKNLYTSLINNFNKKYLLHYTSNTAINQIDDIKFNDCLKHSFVVIACLVFVSKDEGNHQFTNQKLKELLDQFIFSSLKKIKYITSTKIKSFIGRVKPTKKELYNCTNAIIKLLYNNKNEYTSLKTAFTKINSSIAKLSLNEISNILNNTILYCFNSKNIKSPLLFKNNVSNNNKNKAKRLSKNKNELNKNQIDELIPTAPYIRDEMTKKFCLVLDIDETITHTLKLSSGDYFLMRPGVKEFLEEMIKYFEIVIFTSSPKNYADNILDKIDINNEFFSYRLYRRHVCYENGNSVKKLSMIGRDLKKIVFVDNLKSNAKYNPNNLYHIKSWYNDIFDNQLILLKDKLKDIVTSGKYDDDITKGICNL